MLKKQEKAFKNELKTLFVSKPPLDSISTPAFLFLFC